MHEQGIWKEFGMTSQACEWLLTWVLQTMEDSSGGWGVEGVQSEERAQQNAHRNERLWDVGSKKTPRLIFSSLVIFFFGKKLYGQQTKYAIFAVPQRKDLGSQKRGWVGGYCLLRHPNKSLWSPLDKYKSKSSAGKDQTFKILQMNNLIVVKYLIGSLPGLHSELCYLWQNCPSPGISMPLHLHSLCCLSLLFHSQHKSIVATRGTGIIGGSAHSESRTNLKWQAYSQTRPTGFSEAQGAKEPFQLSARAMG